MCEFVHACVLMCVDILVCVKTKADVCLPQSPSAVFAEVSQLNLELINMVSLAS